MRPQVCSVLVWSVSRSLHHNNYIPVIGVCRPACHDSSLYLFALIYFLETVVLSEVHVALNIFYQHIVHFIGVLSTTTTFVFATHAFAYCRQVVLVCSVSVHTIMSSTKRRLESNYPSIFTPLFSQFNLLDMLSNVAVNSFGEMVSHSLTLLLILICSLYCH